MTGAEQGFLLLTSHLGDPSRKVLTVPQFRDLGKAVSYSEKPEPDRELTERDLINFGYNRDFARRVLELLSHREQLEWYLETAARADCVPITRVSKAYPENVWRKLWHESPGCLWAKGDIGLLEDGYIAVVGSRELRPENRRFAEEAGRQIALQGYTLVSGNAKGADTVAQEACLEAGGRVISVVADSLKEHPVRTNVLYVSEDGFDLPFSPQRALSRNRLIHCLGDITLVAQCTLGKGGTWDGTTKNLQHNWNEVFSFSDGSSAHEELVQRGANSVDISRLSNLHALFLHKYNKIDI